jgi:hypothetical protein
VFWKLCSSCWSFHLLREEFLLAPIQSPLYGRQIGPSSGIRAGSGLIDSNQSKIQRWRTRNEIQVLHTLMAKSTRCGRGGWQRFSGKGQILWDVTVNTTYVHPINFLAPGSRDMHDANNKAACFILYVSLI